MTTQDIVRYVEVGHHNGIAFDVFARVVLRNGKVEIGGADAALVAELRAGVDGGDGEAVMPAEGLAFLYAVSAAYHGRAVLASEVRDGEPPADG